MLFKIGRTALVLGTLIVGIANAAEPFEPAPEMVAADTVVMRSWPMGGDGRRH